MIHWLPTSALSFCFCWTKLLLSPRCCSLGHAAGGKSHFEQPETWSRTRILLLKAGWVERTGGEGAGLHPSLLLNLNELQQRKAAHLRQTGLFLPCSADMYGCFTDTSNTHTHTHTHQWFQRWRCTGWGFWEKCRCVTQLAEAGRMQHPAYPAACVPVRSSTGSSWSTPGSCPPAASLGFRPDCPPNLDTMFIEQTLKMAHKWCLRSGGVRLDLSSNLRVIFRFLCHRPGNSGFAWTLD